MNYINDDDIHELFNEELNKETDSDDEKICLINYDNLVDNNYNFVLCDFHQSKYHTVPYNTKCKLENNAGTKYFIAPEIYEHYFTKKSDIYSLGCILYSLYAKTHYRGDIKHDLLKNTPSKMTTLLSDTLRINPNERPTIYDIKNNYDLK